MIYTQTLIYCKIMEQQIDSIGLYADTIALKDSADWELKMRRAVIENSAEYKQEQATKTAIQQSVEESTDDETKTSSKQTKTQKTTSRCNWIQCNDWNTFLLIVIAFLLLLNLIFNK